MARPPRQNPGNLSPGQAHYVLERLIKDRKVSSSDISTYVAEMGREISDLEQRLQRLRDAAGNVASAAASGIAAGAASVASVVRRGRKPGRPAGSGRGPGRPPGRPAGSGRGPGRPPGRPAGSGRGPGRPPANATATASTGASAAAAPAATSGAKGGAKGSRKQRAAITPEQLASRQLQGRYLALVRRFPENKRAQYAKVAKEKGREAAIKEMTEAGGKK